jgi:hypothetical protein
MTEPWELSDEELLKECEWRAHRTSGPGGQKRNKTHSAIQIIHLPTGEEAGASESRMQGENRTHALKRLRHNLVLHLRRDIDPETYTPPAELKSQIGAKGKLAVNPENAKYLPIIATMLDLLVYYKGQVSTSADRLGISTTNFINLLHKDSRLWTIAQDIRKKNNLPSLKAG